MGSKPPPRRTRPAPSPMLRAAVGKAALGVAFTAAVVALLLWLAGAFERKIEHGAEADRGVAALPAAGDRPRAAAALITQPRIETAVGTVRAVHELTVASKILARVESIGVTAGSAVQAGEVIAVLESEDLQARLEQATAALAAARTRRDQLQREHERVREIFASGAANELELNRARAAFEAAESEVRRAEQAQREAETILSYATIRAPISGAVIEKLVEAGDTVAPGQPMIVLYDPDRMQLVASVRESLTQRLRVGEMLDVRIDSLDLQCAGQISEIVPEAAEGSRSFLVKVTGPCPEGVYSGMFGRLLIPLDEEQVLVIPQEAVRRVGQVELVEVIVNDRLLRRAVRTGRAMPGGRVEILSGLREGEVVALPPRGEPGA